jgi:hypothetical protein
MRKPAKTSSKRRKISKMKKFKTRHEKKQKIGGDMIEIGDDRKKRTTDRNPLTNNGISARKAGPSSSKEGICHQGTIVGKVRRTTLLTWEMLSMQQSKVGFTKKEYFVHI